MHVENRIQEELVNEEGHVSKKTNRRMMLESPFRSSQLLRTSGGEAVGHTLSSS